MNNDYETGVKHALSAAALVLEDSAEDYESEAARNEGLLKTFKSAAFRQAVTRATETALVLREQAAEIRALKVARGRC